MNSAGSRLVSSSKAEYIMTGVSRCIMYSEGGCLVFNSNAEDKVKDWGSCRRMNSEGGRSSPNLEAADRDA